MNDDLIKKIKKLYFDSKSIRVSSYRKGLNEKYIIHSGKDIFLLKVYDSTKVKHILNFENYFKKGGFNIILPLRKLIIACE